MDGGAERQLWYVDLGQMPYGQALELQRRVARARITGALPHDIVLLVEHPPVVTMGRSAREQNLVASPEFLAVRGVELFEVERGGDVTFHGPGQLVGYPIFNLRQHRQDLHWYLRELEETLIRALAATGLGAERSEGLTGVWTNGRKIASIGVHARDWVTWHGFALNINTDLSYFNFIVPCGISGVTMTSVANELRHPADFAAITRASVDALAERFSLVPVAHSLEEILDLIADPAAVQQGKGAA